MRPRVAVTTGYILRDLATPKTAALLFDHLAVFGLSTILAPTEKHWWGPSDEQQQLAHWLVEAGVLLEEQVTFEGEIPDQAARSRAWAYGASDLRAESPPAIVTDYLRQGERVARHRWELPSSPYGGVSGEMDAWRYRAHDIITLGGKMDEVARYWASTIPGYLGNPEGPLYTTCREVAGALREQSNYAAAVFGQQIEKMPDWGHDTTVEVVLHALPQPADDTPWEAILDFRADPDALGKRVRLLDWINRVSREDTDPGEFGDRLEAMLVDYEEHMRLHRLKSTRGLLETVVVTSAEIAENLAKFQWGKAAKALFSVSTRQVALLEAERGAPNRDIAYLVAARERFQ